jgi:hypothetical protein
MRKATKLSAVIGTIVVLGLAVPATADDVIEPQITDTAGDGNFINGGGNTANVAPAGPDTRPASIDGLDLRTITFQTLYKPVKMRDLDGSVISVDYRATGLQVDLTTTGPMKPTFAPSVRFSVPTTIGGCETWFQGWIRGPQATPNDVERADIRKITAACPGGAATVSNGFDMVVTGNTMSLTYPFSAPAFTGAMAGFIEDGTELGPPPAFINSSGFPAIRVSHATPAATAFPLVADEGPKFESFTVGSDLPADVVCANEPTHPDCA